MSDVAAFTPFGVVAYAERGDAEESKFDRLGRRAAAPLIAKLAALRGVGARRFLARVTLAARGLDAMEDAALRAAAGRAGVVLRRGDGLGGEAMAPLFAVLREVALRTLKVRPYDVQLMGARAITRGLIAEMRTGEGKTLTAAIAAAAAALAGWPVHVITTNDYLAVRDSGGLEAFYAFLGLSIGVVRQGQDAAERREAYLRDVVYGSNKEIAFDYLRDRMRLRRDPGNLRRKLDVLLPRAGLEPLRMRGLHFAIVDEADSVLIDEARTPLIIAGAGGDAVDAAVFRAAHDAAGRLVKRRDYVVSERLGKVELTEVGRDNLEQMADAAGGGFAVAVIREHAVTQALTAAHLFHRDEHYLIRDGKICIIDEYTGRVMADRTWSDGLHQMVEMKEGLEPSRPHATLARMTYQRFFRRYRRLAGMTGTASDAAWEFWSVYGLAVARIPTNRPDARVIAPACVAMTAARKWRVLADRVAALHAAHRPVLLGVRSVAESDEASALLAARDVPHEVLSAAQDADEAAKIAWAGQPGHVTVATNMAGRGVDIGLGEGVAARGGLCVILSECHDSRRIDRQLAGRCGRQGDPGRVETYISLDDDLMRGDAAAGWRRLARLFLLLSSDAGVRACVRLRQRAVERRHAVMRRDLLESDRTMQDLLAMSGRLE